MKRLLVFLMMMTAPAFALPLRSVGCAATAEAAVKQMLAKTAIADVADGYRVEAVRFDGVRGKTWAVVASCADPSWPRVAMPIEAQADVVRKKTLLVHSGDRVTVLSDVGATRMELMGWAEAAGGEGDAMDVRLGSLSGDGSRTKVRCRVVKAGVVEVVR